jgi:hypothetical protein
MPENDPRHIHAELLSKLCCGVVAELMGMPVRDFGLLASCRDRSTVTANRIVLTGLFLGIRLSVRARPVPTVQRRGAFLVPLVEVL